LKNAGPPTVDQTLEKMQKENGKLQEEIGDLREQIKTLGIEKDVLAQQYQQYILRLNGQIRTISSQVLLSRKTYYLNYLWVLFKYYILNNIFRQSRWP
jgi:peptidoglycan hydrolase CwlO-like protein